MSVWCDSRRQDGFCTHVGWRRATLEQLQLLHLYFTCLFQPVSLCLLHTCSTSINLLVSTCVPPPPTHLQHQHHLACFNLCPSASHTPAAPASTCLFQPVSLCLLHTCSTSIILLVSTCVPPPPTHLQHQHHLACFNLWPSASYTPAAPASSCLFQPVSLRLLYTCSTSIKEMEEDEAKRSSALKCLQQFRDELHSQECREQVGSEGG